MANPSRYGRPSLTGTFIIFLSLFNIVTSSPLPDDHVNLVPRTTLITVDRYLEFLRTYFQRTDKYLFYTGNSYDQVTAFLANNAGYETYKTMIEGPRWPDFFNEEDDEDNAEAASEAIATLASGDVLVFGGLEWKTKGTHSVFYSHETPKLKEGLADGRVKSVNHMSRGATDPSQVSATDDCDRNSALTWKSGHSEGETNASPCNTSKRSLSRRDPRDSCEGYEDPQENPPPPQGDPKSLQIISEQVLCESPGCDSYAWKFMEGEPGIGVDPCGNGIRDNVALDGSSSGDVFPNGEWTMRFAGYAEDCRYQGLGEKRPDGDVGWLYCPERPAIKCVESSEWMSGNGERKQCDGFGKGSIGVAHCDWE